MITTPDAPATFRAAFRPLTSNYSPMVMGTPGLVSYWRLGDVLGPVAADERGINPGAMWVGCRLGQPGALVADLDSAAGFDGSNDELRLAGTRLALSSQGSLEGWFNMESGVALRDSTSVGGWILAYGAGGRLAYRVGGKSYTTSLSLAGLRNAWHHFVLTKSGSSTVYYLDGALVHSGTAAPSTPAVLPWRVMRSGTTTSFARGRADEVAIYATALTGQQVANHYTAGAG
jgi:hypothetical protein